MSTPLAYEIKEFDEASGATAGDLAALHAALLGHSPIPMLGLDFARDFYYTVLPREGYIFGAVAYVEGKPAGFIVATAAGGDFLIRAARAHLFRVGWLIFKSLVRKPSRISQVSETVYRMYKRASIPPAESELLSMGVLPEYGAKFTRRTGVRLSQELVRVAVEGCRRRGAALARASVERTNLGVQFMYSTLGWTLSEDNVLDGTGKILEYTLRLSCAGEAGNG